MLEVTGTTFDPEKFLSKVGMGRNLVHLRAKDVFFSQGEVADTIYYMQSGRARVTVVSSVGREVTTSILNPKEFFGEESIVPIPGLRLSTTMALTPCIALKIDRREMIQVMEAEPSLSKLFLGFLLLRSMKIQAALVDHFFHTSEQRLARILLNMTENEKPGEDGMVIPRVTQEMLAEMVGTTRSRVSFFMNRFRERGFVEYRGNITVNKSLQKVLLRS